MLELNYEEVDGNYLVEDIARDNDGKEQKILIYDVTDQFAGRTGAPILGTQTGRYSVVCEEGRDYFAVVDYPGSDCRHTSISFSVRGGELIILQDEDFTEAVEIVTQLMRKKFHNLNVMRLSRWNLDIAIELAIDRIEDDD